MEDRVYLVDNLIGNEALGASLLRLPLLTIPVSRSEAP